MHDRLSAAIELVQSVRFSGDLGRPLSGGGSLESSRIHYQFNEKGLRLSADMTPGIFGVLDNVCQRLKIESNNVLAYVYASPEIQAGCFSADTRDCLITFSSGLIKLMSDDELAFVIGHELGHFLLGHGTNIDSSDSSTEGMIQQRCKEISADRIGMLACSSKNAAFRSLIKTTAGLSEEYLRFDIRTYLDQIRRASSSTNFSMGESTHPSLVMRCRALLWFSMSKECVEFIGGSAGEPLSEVDKRLANDLKKFVDGPAHQRISDAKNTLEIWLTAAAAIRDGSMSRKEQSLISETLGPDILDKLMSLFSGCGRLEVEMIVREKLQEAIDYYQSIAPRDYDTERGKLAVAIGKRFSQNDFPQFISDFLSEINSSAH